MQNNDSLLSSSRGLGKWKKTLNGTGGGRGQHKNNGNYFGAKGEQLQGPAAPSAAVQKVSLMPCPVHQSALAVWMYHADVCKPRLHPGVHNSRLSACI